jgi:hypothetical protein
MESAVERGRGNKVRLLRQAFRDEAVRRNAKPMTAIFNGYSIFSPLNRSSKGVNIAIVDEAEAGLWLHLTD